MIDLSYLKDWAWETEYLAQVSAFIPGINAIAIHWRSETLFRRWFPRLRSKYVLDKLIIPKAVSEETALIILSDELYRVPEEIRALTVFKQYVSNEDTTSIPFPLGVRRGFPSLAPKPIAERSIDVGFIGRTYPHRKAFLDELSNHERLRRFSLRLTCETRLSISEFSQFLNDTKISLCLGGNCSPETFRYYESTKLGCIVVTPRMPANALYASHPGIQIDEINDVDEVAAALESVLQAPEGHEALQEQSLSAWEKHYSPQAVAAMIKRTVESKKRNNPGQVSIFGAAS
jgi:hypothetical protein